MNRLIPKKRNLSLSLLLIPVGLASGCFTPAKEQQLKGDIFNLQTRLLQVEDYLSKKSDDKTEFKVASTQTRMDQLQLELQKIKGEIDTLRVGVTTGKMPGVDEKDAPEGSVTQTLTSIQSRLETLEESQSEILAAISKYSSKSGGKGEEKEKKGAAGQGKDVKEFKDAYHAKRYKFVIENAKAVLEKSPKKEKQELLYFYAESLYKLGKLRDAALQYNDFVEKYPSAKDVPHAKMRMGDCFRHLGDISTAKLYYSELVDKYPKSEEAEKAKERLKGL